MQQSNSTLDSEAVRLERLCLKKNSRSGHASTVTAISNEISGLLSGDRNLQEVKEKLWTVPLKDLERPIETMSAKFRMRMPLLRVNPISKTKRESSVFSVSRSSIG